VFWQVVRRQLATATEEVPWVVGRLAEVGAWIEDRYNRRRHSTLNYLTPEEAELRYRHELPLAA